MDTTAENEKKSEKLDGQTIYGCGAFLLGFIVFILSWLYCIKEYGYLFGVGLGWLPSIIVALIAGAIWPVVIIVLIGIMLFNYH